ncbi:hypothetical protein [Xanthomonas euvesicatoria]|uniref:hypothetical protein n=1 Tax=Xanthomonas euvesicatoria TaxID=456327 RepID=UPI0030C82A47
MIEIPGAMCGFDNKKHLAFVAASQDSFAATTHTGAIDGHRFALWELADFSKGLSTERAQAAALQCHWFQVLRSVAA